MTPRYSLGSWAFSFGPFASAPWSFDAFCDYARDAGYHGIEINGFRPHPHPDDHPRGESRRALATRITDRGLGISGYAPDFTATPPAVCETSAYLASVTHCLDFCHDLGITILRVDTVSPPRACAPAEDERHFATLCRTWRAAAERCAAAGVTLAWEFEPGFWLNRPSDILRLVRTIDHPAFTILFDSSHAHMCAAVGARQDGEREVLAGGAAAFARLLRGHIGHLHLIDSDGTLHGDETSTHAPFGTGHIDFPELLIALGPDLERTPWWCFDFCFCDTTERDARLAIPFMDRVRAGLASGKGR